MASSTRPRKTLKLVAFSLLLLTLSSAFILKGCSATVPRRNPVGETFPTVQGEALTGQTRQLPTIFAGRPAVVLVGYAQNSQFDIDRWLLGLSILETPAALAEVPTIPGLAPTLFSGMIDNGMRRGIPQDDWSGVITTYGSQAAKIRDITGNENDLPARVFLLDPRGLIVWFHDDGFSPRVLRELDDQARALSNPGEKPPAPKASEPKKQP